MIRLDNITFAYPLRKPLFHRSTYSLTPGGRYRITGPSGSGKTTLLRLLMGLEKPKHGRVVLPEGTRFSVVFQEDRLIPHKTVMENLVLFATETDALAVLKELFDEPVADRYPEELSGGMKRRVALARALAHDSDVLILDEAFTGLDAAAKTNALAVTKQWLNGRTLVLVDHDDGVAEVLRTVSLPVDRNP